VSDRVCEFLQVFIGVVVARANCLEDRQGTQATCAEGRQGNYRWLKAFELTFQLGNVRVSETAIKPRSYHRIRFNSLGLALESRSLNGF
jgi:hypothetical protein